MTAEAVIELKNKISKEGASVFIDNGSFIHGFFFSLIFTYIINASGLFKLNDFNHEK